MKILFMIPILISLTMAWRQEFAQEKAAAQVSEENDLRLSYFGTARWEITDGKTVLTEDER